MYCQSVAYSRNSLVPGVTHAFIPRKNRDLLEDAIEKDPDLLNNFNVTLVDHVTELIPHVFVRQSQITPIGSELPPLRRPLG